MPLTPADVQRIANLARIELTPAEVETSGAELNLVLSLIEQMRAVDLSGVEPLYQPQELSVALREDRVTETDQRSLFQAVAPRVEDGLYLVPKVIE